MTVLIDSISGKPLSQEDIEEGKKYKAEYYDTWYDIFGGLLGWSKDQVNEWAKKWRHEGKEQHWLDDPNDLMYHEHAMHWACNAFVPKTLLDKYYDGEKYPKDKYLEIHQVFNNFGRDIESLFYHHSDDKYGFGYKKTNWKIAKQDYQVLIDKYTKILAEMAV